MADQTLNIRLDPYTARKLQEAADAAGVSPERMAVMTLEAFAAEDNEEPGVREPKTAWTAATDRSNQPSATTPEDYEGPYIELDDALNAFDAELNRRLADRSA